MDETLTTTLRLHKLSHDAIVYLPPDYNDTHCAYPVLYLHDGQNLFDPATAFAGNDWGLDDLAEELIQSGQIEPLIIVGIYNAGEKRMAEYTHVRDRRGRGGRARAYGKFLVEELKPFIDGEYRTLGDPANTGLGGSSLGGLVTLYLGLHYPDTFGKLIIMSPSVWWANRAILREVRRVRERLPQKIWLDIGTCEGQDPDACVKNAEELAEALVAKGWQPEVDFMFVEDQGAGHDEKAWGYRMRAALQFLFPPANHE